MAKKKHIEVDEQTHQMIKELAIKAKTSMRDYLNKLALEKTLEGLR